MRIPYLSHTIGILSKSNRYQEVLVSREANQLKGLYMPVESSGQERGNPRMFALIENSPKTGDSPTVWAFPQFVEFLKVAGQPVQGPWPPHQEPRPDPDADSMPTAVPDTGH